MKSKTLFAVSLMLFCTTALHAQDLSLFRDANGKYGYKDKTGKIIIEPKYDKAFEFSEGLASIRQNGKWGYIDKSGTEIVKPQYSYTESFHNGIAYINIGGKVDGYGNVDGGKWGLMNKAGKEIVPPKYDEVYRYFIEDYTIVKLNEKYGVIDNTGKETVPPKYDMIPNPEEPQPYPLQEVWLDGKAGFVELKTGKEIVPLIYDDVVPFSEDLAAVNTGGEPQNFRVLGGKWGFVDTTGKEVIPLVYDIPDPIESLRFQNGKVQVSKDGRTFFIDKTGKEMK
jgi:hypothetical protein